MAPATLATPAAYCFREGGLAEAKQAFEEIAKVSGGAHMDHLFLALHAFDDHRMIKLAIRRIRPEIVLSFLGCWQ